MNVVGRLREILKRFDNAHRPEFVEGTNDITE